MPVRKILVVDDSPTDRQFMLETLAKKGYQVVTADSGEDAIVYSVSDSPVMEKLGLYCEQRKTRAGETEFLGWSANQLAFR